MTRFHTFSISALCVLGLLRASGQQPPVFRGTSEVVPVFVTVIDKDGRLVTKLGREAFEIRDDGKPQPITQFDDTPRPIRLVVMLDVSSSMEGNLPLLRAASQQLIARLGPDDVARIGTFGREVTISPTFTRDAHALLAALPDAIAPDAPTPLWRAIDQALDTFGQERESRAVILVLSDGKDFVPPSFRQRTVSQAEVIDRARKEEVMIYGVGMRSRPRQQPMTPGIGSAAMQAMLMADMPDPGLARVAEETGGGYTEIRFGQDLGAAFAGVADELHSQYLLGFAPPRRDGKTHSISVRMARTGLTPRARKSYIAPKGE
jgi:Ca-activated chloride channel homolog